jgi:hypothetical protein
MLLEKGADVNAKNTGGNTALSWASWRGHTETAVMLLEKGSDVNAKDDYARTALHSASSSGHTETVAMLLEKGADVNAKDNDGTTALIDASIQIRPEVVTMLLKRKDIIVNATDKDGLTALHRASAAIGHTRKGKKIIRELGRQQDRENLAMVMSKKDVGNRGDGTMPYDLRRKIGEYLGGGKRKTKKSRRTPKRKTRK